MNLTAKTFRGLEPVLAEELAQIGATNIIQLRRAVSFDATKEVLYKANLHLRTALRILQPLQNFKARNENELYNKVFDFDWGTYLTLDQTFAVDAVTHSDFFNHSKYVALKVKDAIADKFVKKTGRRPSVDVERPNFIINVHISQDTVTISLDSTGESLHRRGYRTADHIAPLNEVLAAGMLLLSGWKGDKPLVDPMCGSGTIVLEAAMIAGNIAPGLKRKEFGFMHWGNFDKELWDKIKAEAQAMIVPPKTHIAGSDIQMKFVDLARQSALDFNIKSYIHFSCSPFADLVPPAPKGFIVTNPPYGERMKPRDIIDLYQSFGNQLKRQFTGYEAWIISSNFEALKQVGLKPSVKHTLFNGPLECKFLKYSMY